MALVRNAANMIRKGRVGDATYYVSKGQQIVRQARNNSNYGESARRSENQQMRRVMWANLVNFYKASASWMPAAFESKKKGQTDYNKFMSVNMSNARIALTKEQAAAGSCVVDEFIVSQGSLPSVEIIPVNLNYATNIGIGDLTINADTTNAELTAAMIAYNANIREGMQISFVSYQQSVDALDSPRVICRLYEITLSLTSTDKVRDYLPDFCSQSVQNNLGTSSNISTGGFTYILSDKASGQIRVSTQRLVVKNSEMIVIYTSPLQLRNAMVSYGIDAEVVLSPEGTSSKNPEEQPNYIEYAIFEGDTTRYRPGYKLGPIRLYANKVASITFANTIDAEHASIRCDYVVASSYSSVLIASTSISGNELAFQFPEGLTGIGNIMRFVVTISGGRQYVIDFDAES